MIYDLKFLIFSFVHTGKIILFYCVFYGVLAGLVAIMFAVFWQTLDMKQPKWQLDESLIGTNPGLGFRPLPPEAQLGNTLISYNANSLENMTYWFDTVNKFLQGNLLFSFIFERKHFFFIILWN